ncbi:MAG TPA: S26 family signal peptidase, partial [Methanocorpusculum sp.]|nr:S26 family signal peptidase [Methanocorpusculum sp.]
MSKSPKKAESNADADDVQKSSLMKILKSDDPKISLIRDILSVVIVVAIIGGVLFGVSGTWPAIVAVESGSMVPNMNVGDLIFVVEENRFGPLLTAEEAEAAGVTSFNGYG